MSIKIAYNKEMNELMDAYQAREFYLLGRISDQKEFQCQVPGCDARITCKGLYHDEKDLKKRIHFSKVDDCEHSLKKPGVIIKDGDGEIKQNTFVDEKIDVLLDKPRKKEIKVPCDLSSGSNGQDKENRIRRIPGQQPQNKHKPEYGMIRSLVAKFKGFSRENSLKDHYIEYRGKLHRYDYFFKDVDAWNENEWNQLNIDRRVRVYYGNAKIKKVDGKDDFIVNFENQLICLDHQPLLSCYISKKCIDKRYGSAGLIEAFKHFSNTRESFIVYICGYVKIRSIEEKKFMNISVLDDNSNYFHWEQKIEGE